MAKNIVLEADASKIGGFSGLGLRYVQKVPIESGPTAATTRTAERGKDISVAARVSENGCGAPATDEQEDRRRRRLLNLRVAIHQRVLETLNLAAIDGAPEADLRQEVAAISREVLKELGVVVNAQEFEHLVNALIDEVTGLGPLEPLLKDPSITDILVNTHEQCFVERGGKLVLTDVSERWSREFGPLVKLDRLTRKTI